MSKSPPLVQFLALLIERAAPKRVICFGDDAEVIDAALQGGAEVVRFTSSPDAGKPTGPHSPGDPGERVTVIQADLEAPFQIDSALFGDAVVVALGILDTLENPDHLLAALAAARAQCKFLLASAADRTSAFGYMPGSAPSSGSAPHWSAEEFSRQLLGLGFPPMMLFGFCAGTAGPARKDTMVVLAGAQAQPGLPMPGSDFRIAAVINAYNEADVLGETVGYLAGQGIEVHVIDNWSEDGTFELCQRLLDSGSLKGLSRFPEEKTGDYEWGKQLEHAAQYAAALEVDWILHYDADEIRCSPWRGVSLFDGIRFVDNLGYSAIDFTVIDFRFTDDVQRTFAPGDYEYFEFGRHSSCFMQVKAWKKTAAQVDLARFAGHDVVFPGKKIYPLKFLNKHYSLRSRSQATSKIFRDRVPRIAKERQERGWHVHFDQYRHLDRIEPWSPEEVVFYDQRSFEFEFLLERLSGVGVAKEEQVFLNRNTAQLLNDAASRMADRISALDAGIAAAQQQASSLRLAVADRDERIAGLDRAIVDVDRARADLNRLLAARDRQISDQAQALAGLEQQVANLHSLVADRDEKVASLGQLMTARDRQIGDLSEELAKRGGQISSLGQLMTAKDRQIADLGEESGKRDKKIASLNQAVDEAGARIATLTAEVAALRASASWKITAPVRLLGKPIAATMESWRLFRHAVRLGGGYGATASLLVQVLRKEGVKGIAWRLGNARTLIQTNPTFLPPQASRPEAEDPQDVYVPRLEAAPLANKAARLICFYLPQFHPIPENDAWWGKGFTEWTNVRPAQPQFQGHYQPHVPGELGYYNLLDPAVQRRQVELARLYGLEGFCFYFYWFGGKRLLEAPLENYLNDSSLDLPFCLCWANENWSRRWDGLDSEILIAQQYSTQDDLAFIEHVARYMADPRYIRIAGKPLLLVYRPNLLPCALETASRWRSWCRANGIGEIYLAYTQSFESVDPQIYGFDAAIEFPPNNSAPRNITGSVKALRGDFGSIVYDWRGLAERSEHYLQPGYTLLRGVCPGWDNTARRKNHGTVFLNSTPALYRRWLENAIRDTQQHHDADERLVFVNAWNEWAEGAHLEPDQRHGYAYLQATRDALASVGQPEARRIVLVAHDGYPHGAQFLALHLARTLSQEFGFKVDMVCLGDGPLKADYARVSRLHDLAGQDPRGPAAMALAQRLYREGHRSALVNTTVSGYFLETLADAGLECVALIHELGGVLEQFGLQGQVRAIAARASRIVFPAEEVARSFADVAPSSGSRAVIRPQGLYKRARKPSDRNAERSALRRRLDVPDESHVVLGVGYADHRKGIDLFVDAGLAMAQRVPGARWVWIGHWDAAAQAAVESKLLQAPLLRDRFIFPGLQADTSLYYLGADVFALTSREDPFPSVVLEAMDAALPVVAFEGAGGFADLLNEGCGRLVAQGDAAGFANTVGDILEQPGAAASMGGRGAELVAQRFSFRHYVFDLLEFAGQRLPRISAVVPNFNYAHYLPERLASIVRQSQPLFEIIFLDDCSNDQSVSVASEILDSCGVDYRIVRNERNSGSVFSQWKKGVDLAAGDHVWIAEADDSCEEDFLAEVMKGFDRPGVVLSYCESKQVDEDGRVLADNYLDYVADISADRWRRSYVNTGHDEVSQVLSVKNTIPNVSGVVFEKSGLKAVLDDHMDEIRGFRVAGDWLVYVLLLRDGHVAFSPIALNRHRRHSRGLTIGNFNQGQLDEIARMQAYVAREFEVPAHKATVAGKYLEQLARQFGLTA